MSTALAEALLAAQRQAVAALSKAYVADKIDAERLAEELDSMGLRDIVDQGLLLNALGLVRDFGAALPTNGVTPKPSPETEPASQKQLDYLAKLADEKQTMPPDGPLTKAKASEAISALQAGTYNPDDYCAPF